MRLKILLLSFLVVLITGCSNTKKVIEPEEFSSILAKYEYQILDKTNTVDYADAAYYVDTDEFVFIYVDGKRKYDIEGLFIEECKNVVSEIGSSEYEKEIGTGENYSTLKITTDSLFYYVSWVDDTYIYIRSPLRKQKKMTEIINELGY